MCAKMICKNCGNPLADGAAFCGSCGTPVEQPVAEQPVTEQPVAEQPVAEQPAGEQFFNLADNGNTEAQVQYYSAEESAAFETPKKKSFWSKLKRKRVILPAIALALAAVIVFNLGWIKGFYMKNFASDKSYSVYVEKKEAANYADYASSFYGIIYDALDFDNYTEGEMKLNINSDALGMAQGVFGAGGNQYVEMLEKLAIKYTQNVKDGVNSSVISLNLGNQEILKIEGIMDVIKDEMYVGLGQLSNDYLKVDGLYNNIYGDNFAKVQQIYSKVFSGKGGLQKLLPSEKTVNNLLDKYIGIAFDALEGVEKYSENVTVGETSQKLTVLEYNFTEKNLYNIAEAVLAEAVKDKEIKKIVENAADYIASLDLSEFGAEIDSSEFENAYTEMQSAMQNALQEIKTQKAGAGTSNGVIVRSYVSGSNDVVGRVIEVEGQEVFGYVTVQKGKSFEYELFTPQDVLTIYGAGTKNGDVVTGEYEIGVKGKNYVIIELEKFNLGKLSKGELKGTLRVKPSSEAMDLLGEEASMVTMMDPAIELVFNTSGKSSKVDINLITSGEMVFGFSLSSSSSDAKKLSKPSDSNVVDANNSNNAIDWVENLNYNKIAEALEKADAPSELVNAIKEAVEKIPSLIKGLENGIDLPSFGGSIADSDVFSEDYADSFDYSDYEDYANDFDW